MQRFKMVQGHNALPASTCGLADVRIWKAGIAIWDRCSGAVAKE